MALLKTGHTEPGTRVEADVRGKMIEAETCALPFYKR
jgi:aminomethyltransferase